jgi:hypothetical protein
MSNTTEDTTREPERNEEGYILAFENPAPCMAAIKYVAEILPLFS